MDQDPLLTPNPTTKPTTTTTKSSTTTSTTTTTTSSRNANVEKLKRWGLKYLRHTLNPTIFILFLLVLLQYHQPKVPEFGIDSASITILGDVSNAHNLTANWEITFYIKSHESHDSFKPNGYPLLYNNINASIFHDKKCISNVSIPPFEFGSGFNQQIVVAKFIAVHTPEVVKDLAIELEANVTYTGFVWPLKSNLMKIVCDDVKLVFSSNSTTLIFGSRKCNVDSRWQQIFDGAEMLKMGICICAGIFGVGFVLLLWLLSSFF